MLHVRTVQTVSTSLNHRQSTHDTELTVPKLAFGKDGCLKGLLSPKILQATGLGRSQDWSRVPLKLWFFIFPFVWGELWVHWDNLETQGNNLCNLGDVTGKTRFSRSVQEEKWHSEISCSHLPPLAKTHHPNQEILYTGHCVTVYFKLLLRSCYLFKTSNKIAKSWAS